MHAFTRAKLFWGGLEGLSGGLMAGKGVCPREGVCDGVTPVEICPGDLSMGLPRIYPGGNFFSR